MRIPTALLSILAMSACGPNDVVVKGIVFSGPDSVDERLPSAKITLYDADGETYDTTRADAKGKFEAVAPEGEYIHAEITASGFESTLFTGVSGLDEVYRVEDGMIYGFPTAELEVWEGLFAGCPGADESGGIVLGEIRMLELSQDGENPLVNGTAEVVSKNQKQTWKACYLDEEGLAYDPDATTAGPSGRFAIFGIAPGTRILTVGWEYIPEVWSYSDTYVFVQEDGVAPRFPSWVEWPEI